MHDLKCPESMTSYLYNITISCPSGSCANFLLLCFSMVLFTYYHFLFSLQYSIIIYTSLHWTFFHIGPFYYAYLLIIKGRSHTVISTLQHFILHIFHTNIFHNTSFLPSFRPFVLSPFHTSPLLSLPFLNFSTLKHVIEIIAED